MWEETHKMKGDQLQPGPERSPNPVFSTQPKAINPRLRLSKSRGGDEDDLPAQGADKIDPFGENPGWDPDWVKAHKINYLGRVINLVVFLLFNMIFWGIALSHYYAK